MTIDIVKCIVFVIAVSILYGVIGHLNCKKIAISGKIQSDAQYIVTLPSALKYVYTVSYTHLDVYKRQVSHDRGRFSV